MPLLKPSCFMLITRNASKLFCNKKSLSDFQQIRPFSIPVKAKVSKNSGSALPNFNIGTIGHIDHGKTTLSAAITKILSERGKTKFRDFEEIDNAEEEKKRGITINAAHLQYITDKRHYAHTDCPGHMDFIKNMITGTSQMDAAILVVAGSEGTMPQTREHVLLARQIGVKHIVVYINKADLCDEEMLELVHLEVMDLLLEHGYKESDVHFVTGSALCALEDRQPELGKESIDRLMEVLDNEVPLPQRQVDGPFFMPIDSCMKIQGRGTVTLGTIERGTLRKGDKAELVGFGKVIETTVSDIEVFNKRVDSAVAGDHLGALLRGVKKEAVERGMTLVSQGSFPLVNKVRAQVYLQSEVEGGKNSPVTSGSYSQLYCDTFHVGVILTLPPEMELLMPGESAEVTYMLRYGMALQKGDKFFVREGRETTVTGVVTEVLPFSDEHIVGFNHFPKGWKQLLSKRKKEMRNKRDAAAHV